MAIKNKIHSTLVTIRDLLQDHNHVLIFVLPETRNICFFYRRGGFGGVLFCHKLSKKLSTNSLRVREFVPAEWFLCCCQDTSSSLIVRGILRSYEKKPEVFRIRIRFFFCLFGSGYGSICIFCFNLLTKDQQQLKPIFSTKKNIYAKTCYVNYYFQHKLSLLWSSGKHKNSKFGVLNIIF